MNAIHRSGHDSGCVERRPAERAKSRRAFGASLRRLALGCVASVLCLVGAPATAHAFLDHALPAVGSTVRESPHDVRLWFTERLEPAFSRVRVVDAAGKAVDSGDSHLDPSNEALLTVTLPTLSPGAYRVEWRVVSVDTHVTEGDFTFEIKP